MLKVKKPLGHSSPPFRVGARFSERGILAFSREGNGRINYPKDTTLRMMSAVYQPDSPHGQIRKKADKKTD
jgi:hypothetical protein